MPHPQSALAIACFTALGGAALAAEYVGGDVPGLEGGTSNVATPTDNLRRIPENAYQPPRVGLPYRNIFRDTSAPYYNALRDVKVDPLAQPAESLKFSGSLDLPDFRGRFPLLQRGFAPEDADLKIGPLYFKLRHISMAVLHSDNVFQDDRRKEGDTLGYLSIGGQVMAQLTEGFHLALGGNFVVLPFENDEGLYGLSLNAPYAFGLAGTPSAEAQVAWEPTFFGLPFVFADQFTVGLARFTNTGYDWFDNFDGFDTDIVDSAGIYALRAPTVPVLRNDDLDRNRNRDNVEFLYYSNEISVSTGGPFPGTNIFRFRASHENIWYEENGSGLPRQRDRVFFGLQSVRENIRFKPYGSYDYIRTVKPDREVHRLRAGVRGPITELLDFQGELGYYFNPNRDEHGLLWRVAFYHTPNPRIRQSLVIQRSISEFADEIASGVTYRVSKVLGPNLTGAVYAGWHRIEDYDGAEPDRNEFRSGLSLRYLQSPRTSYLATLQYAQLEYQEGFGNFTNWRGRFEVRHQFLKRLYGRMVFQHEIQDGDGSYRDFTENLFYLSLSWIFE